MTLLVRLVSFMALAVAAAGAHAANDFPTAERVLYVQECMQANPAPNFEAVSKCSCAVDRIAAEISYDEYVTMQTIANAMTVSGERGNAIRDVPSLKPELKRWRELQGKARKACFLDK